MIREVAQVLFILGCLTVCSIVGKRPELDSTDNSHDASYEHNLILSLAAVKDDHEDTTTAPEPSFQAARDVVLFMFSHKNPEIGFILKMNDSQNLQHSGFHPKKTTKIIIHGWDDTSNSSWVKDMRKTYLNIADHNIIAVDWTSAAIKSYITAARAVHQVGEYLGDFIKYLKFSTNLSLSNVHILGHSLGAHIAGIAGIVLSGQIGRITGLDAARPGFEFPLLASQRNRLDAGDAKFVDVIHTCAGTVGFIRAIGHADFYPNGGSFRQPGCSLLLAQYCSHQRAHEYFIESILDITEFIGVNCDSWENYKANKCDENRISIMGEYILPTTRGKYFLNTTDKPPFAKRHLTVDSHTLYVPAPV